MDKTQRVGYAPVYTSIMHYTDHIYITFLSASRAVSELTTQATSPALVMMTNEVILVVGYIDDNDQRTYPYRIHW